MERRKFVVGLGALASGSAAAIGTGAFDSVEADRNVDVQVTGDASSYLQITGDDDFVGDDSGDGELTIDLGSPGDEAFNPDAVTEVSGVVTIANEGTQDGVVIGFGEDQDQSVELDLEGGTDDAEVTLEFADYDGDDGELDVGQTVNLDVTVDTTEDPNSPSSDEDVTILATTE